MSVIEPQVISTAPPREGGVVESDGAHLPRFSWLDSFRRITTSGEFIPEIDGLRFIAISAVVWRHVAVLICSWLIEIGHPVSAEGLLKYGRHGVELFFVISGFILSTPFAMHARMGTKKVNLKRYFLRRLTRLEPPYVLSMVIYFLVKIKFQSGVAHLADLFYSLFYVAGIMRGHMPWVSIVAWSLEVEVQFYLLMPVLAMIYWISNRWARRSLIVVLAALFVGFGPYMINGVTTGEPYDRTLLNYIQYFLMGLLMADVYATEWNGAPPPLKTIRFAWGDFVWLLGWPALLGVLMLENRAMRALAPPLIFLLYISLFHSVWARKLMRVKWITIIGGMCYSIYLMHNLVMEGSLRLIKHHLPQHYYPAIFTLAAVSIPASLILCGGYFRLIERPCMRPDWPRRFKAWLTGAAPQPSRTAA